MMAVDVKCHGHRTHPCKIDLIQDHRCWLYAMGCSLNYAMTSHDTNFDILKLLKSRRFHNLNEQGEAFYRKSRGARGIQV